MGIVGILCVYFISKEVRLVFIDCSMILRIICLPRQIVSGVLVSLVMFSSVRVCVIASPMSSHEYCAMSLREPGQAKGISFHVYCVMSLREHRKVNGKGRLRFLRVLMLRGVSVLFYDFFGVLRVLSYVSLEQWGNCSRFGDVLGTLGSLVCLHCLGFFEPVRCYCCPARMFVLSGDVLGILVSYRFFLACMS